MGFLVLAAIIGFYHTEPVAEFLKDGNGNPVYEFVYVEDCQTGKRESGFAFAPTGNLLLKQVNYDGSIGEACKR